MNRKDFFRTLFGGAVLAAGAKEVPSGLQGGGRLVGDLNVTGQILFDSDPYERIAPGAFNLPENEWILKGHDASKRFGRILEVSETRDGIGFTYIQDKI